MTAEAMRADGMQLVGTKADLSAVLGTWVNAKPESDNIAKPYVTSGTTDVVGFLVSYEIGPVRTEFAANVKQGILVIQSYTSFSDGSGRVPHYAREFFYQSPTVGLRSVGKGVGSLLGEWINSYSDTAWIKRFTLSEQDGTFSLHALAVNEPIDWGAAPVTEFQDAAGKPAFKTSFEFDVSIVANTGQGLVIIVALVQYKDGRTTWCRESYSRRD